MKVSALYAGVESKIALIITENLLSINSVRILNSTFQIINVGARFLFIFFLAKYLDPALVGYYGIFVATVSYAIYFVGLDYYLYVSREIIKKPPSERGQLLTGHAIQSVALYLAIMPIAIIFLFNADWPEHLAWWFLPILILDHFNQEMSRLLIVLSDPISSSFVLFIRQGAWSIVMVIAMVLEPTSRNLDLVMALWTMAGLFAASFAIWRLRELKTSGWDMPVDWGWIKDGFRISLAFSIGTIALRGVLTLDRYWLERLVGIDAVAAYVLLLGIASSLLILLESAVFYFSYPKLIEFNHKGENREAQAAANRLFCQTISLSFLFGFGSWLALPYLLMWIGNQVYIDYIDLYPWLMSAIILNAVSMVPHYALYARGIDKPIIYSHVSAIIFFITVTWLVSETNPVLAVPVGLNSSFGVILIWKMAAYLTVLAKK